MKIYIKILIVLISSLTFFSCQKEDVYNPKKKLLSIFDYQQSVKTPFVSFIYNKDEKNNFIEEVEVCTQEARECPDGSYVSRTGPNCEFTPCPKTGENSNIQMANPASVFCEKNGGKLDIRNEKDGGQIGYCKFSDEKECEEWAYFRGECKK